MVKIAILQFMFFATLLAFAGVFGESDMTPFFNTRSTRIEQDCHPHYCRFPPDPSTCPPPACELVKFYKIVLNIVARD
ncbi:hypothetical protein Tco_1414400 [Tanacetum coccineum]